VLGGGMSAIVLSACVLAVLAILTLSESSVRPGFGSRV
jgi:hypothetical protein